MLIRPVLDYVSSANVNCRSIKIEKLQRGTLKTIFGFKMSYTEEALSQARNIQSLHDRRAEETFYNFFKKKLAGTNTGYKSKLSAVMG